MKVRLFIGNIPEKRPVSISIRWVPGGKWWDPRKEHREWETHTFPRLKIIREIASEVFRLMAFRIPEWQSFRRFVNISSHVIACHTGVHSASWSCLGSGSSYSSGLLQVYEIVYEIVRDSTKCHVAISGAVSPSSFSFHVCGVRLRQEQGPQSYISWTNLSILSKGLVNPLFSFQAKPLPPFPGWVFPRWRGGWAWIILLYL